MTGSFVTSRNGVKIGRPAIGKHAMTALERQQRRRAKLAKKALRKQDSVLQRQLARADYEARAGNGAKLADLAALAESGERFAVIYADPPWEFKTYSVKGKQRSAERYYDTTSLEAIKALPVAALAADDCVLFMWGSCRKHRGHRSHGGVGIHVQNSRIRLGEAE